MLLRIGLEVACNNPQLLNTHQLSKLQPSSVMLGCSVKVWTHIYALPMSINFWQWLKVFDLFRLLEKKTLETFWEMLEVVCEVNAKVSTNKSIKENILKIVKHKMKFAAGVSITLFVVWISEIQNAGADHERTNDYIIFNVIIR